LIVDRIEYWLLDLGGPLVGRAVVVQIKEHASPQKVSEELRVDLSNGELPKDTQNAGDHGVRGFGLGQEETRSVTVKPEGRERK
jgi:hypothetical protein